MTLNTQTQTDLSSGLSSAIADAKAKDLSILFSYTYQFESRDLLSLLSHPADKNTCRIYWEQPLEGFALAGLGKILEINSDSFSFINFRLTLLKFSTSDIGKINSYFA